VDEGGDEMVRIAKRNPFFSFLFLPWWSWVQKGEFSREVGEKWKAPSLFCLLTARHPIMGGKKWGVFPGFFFFISSFFFLPPSRR